jgi:hypothetical protein
MLHVWKLTSSTPTMTQRVGRYVNNTLSMSECHRFFHQRQIREVRVLMLAGAYTPSLRRAYDAGEDIRGAGILNLKWKVRETRCEGPVHEFCF